MLKFFKQLFGTKTAESTPAPYKVEKPAAKVAEFPFPSANPAAEKKTAEKKPVAKKTAVKKPRAPKSPKA